MRTPGKAPLTALLVLAACGGGSKEPEPAAAEPARTAVKSVRITMDALHQSAGIPPGWHFTVPAGSVEAGRRAFVDLGCQSCHRVAGEPFAADGSQTGIGPDLTGMGSHHPAEYFAESILNPDAVLVDGPGYIGADGVSVMPSYPDLTLRQLADLVAYLRSLRAGGAKDMLAAASPAEVTDVPSPPADRGSIFWAQAYDIEAGRLRQFEEWFAKEGLPGFLAQDGIVSVETYVDTMRDRPWVMTVLGFRSEETLDRFLEEPSSERLGEKFDEFVGPHRHRIFGRPPVYRAPTLSAP
ncbi:MAG TPA: cytochrome c [Candidatus Binatus sp.]|nr:cytochrome c [Candidatus Binatus sp.]